MLTSPQDTWEGDPDAEEGVDDIGFVQDLIDQFKELYCVNETAIYASGKSNGGGLTGLLACNEKLSAQIAAFAPVSGAFYTNATKSECDPEEVAIPCNASRVIPIIEFHGSDDTTINYYGGWRRGACLPTIPHYMTEWSERNGYGSSNVTAESHGDNVIRYEFGNDTADMGIVTSYLIEGMGHSWPSTVSNFDTSDATYVNATPMIMEFFSRWSLPV
jgi:poly(3-hydroxybutyrate) depolymerase